MGPSYGAFEFDVKVAESRTINTSCRIRARLSSMRSSARNVSGIEKINAIETHDCFTTSEYMAIDHFGITKPGESWKAVEEGVIELGGKLPINPSGGLIGAGHPVGCTGVRQMLDLHRQVTGTAGEYQVEGAKNYRDAEYRRQRHYQLRLRRRQIARFMIIAIRRSGKTGPPFSFLVMSSAKSVSGGGTECVSGRCSLATAVAQMRFLSA